MNFSHLCQADIPLLREYYVLYPLRLCEYTAFDKWMFRDYYHSQIAREDGTLFILENYDDDKNCFCYPLGGDLDLAFRKMEAFSSSKGIRLELTSVPQEKLAGLKARYPHAEIFAERDWSDYLYNLSDLASLSGNRYSSQRHSLNNFKRFHPRYAFHLAAAADIPALLAFYERFVSEEDLGADEEKKYEAEKARELISMIGISGLLAGYVEENGAIYAIALGEITGDVLFVHVEKALHSIEGAYQAIVSEFAKAFLDSALYENREDDVGDLGLRESKLRYRPIALLDKYFICNHNYVDFLDKLPELQSKRISFLSLSKQDETSYKKLSLDEETNRWWGYDYRVDLPSGRQPDEAYFAHMVADDFRTKSCLSWMMHDETGSFIGEAVLWNFDVKGGAEIGLRFLPSSRHRGYGKEALAFLSDYAYRILHVTELRVASYKENVPSLALIASLGALKTGEDDEKDYFVLPKSLIH